MGVMDREWRRRRRWGTGLRVAVIAVIVVIAAVSDAYQALAVSVPDVRTAPALVAAVDRSHGSSAVDVASTSRIAEAVMAAEDGRFLGDGPLDLPALARGTWGWLTGVDSGGSTLEVQLARRLYPGLTDDIVGQARVVAIAAQLDARFSKGAILDLYLNAMYWGHGSYGIAAASWRYFGLAPGDLSWAQAATLAGLLQAPSTDDPVHHAAQARSRQEYVLGRLVADGYLSVSAAGAAAAAPLGLVGR